MHFLEVAWTPRGLFISVSTAFRFVTPPLLLANATETGHQETLVGAIGPGQVGGLPPDGALGTGRAVLGYGDDLGLQHAGPGSPNGGVEFAHSVCQVCGSASMDRGRLRRHVREGAQLQHTREAEVDRGSPH